MLSVLITMFIVCLSVEVLAICMDLFCTIFDLNKSITSFIILLFAPFLMFSAGFTIILIMINELMDGGYIG